MQRSFLLNELISHAKSDWFFCPRFIHEVFSFLQGSLGKSQISLKRVLHYLNSFDVLVPCCCTLSALTDLFSLSSSSLLCSELDASWLGDKRKLSLSLSVSNKIIRNNKLKLYFWWFPQKLSWLTKKTS